MREFEGPHYSGGGSGGGGGNMKYDSGRYHLTTASNHSSGNRPGRWAGLLVFQDSQGSARVALRVLLRKLHLQSSPSRLQEAGGGGWGSSRSGKHRLEIGLGLRALFKGLRNRYLAETRCCWSI